MITIHLNIFRFNGLERVETFQNILILEINLNSIFHNDNYNCINISMVKILILQDKFTFNIKFLNNIKYINIKLQQ